MILDMYLGIYCCLLVMLSKSQKYVIKQKYKNCNQLVLLRETIIPVILCILLIVIVTFINMF